MLTPKTEIMLNSASQISKIVRPLEDLGISFFSYVRVYKNGNKIDLNNAPDAADYVYYKTNLVETYEPEINPGTFRSNILLNSQTVPKNQMLDVLRESFDIDHFFVTIIPKKNFYEVWNLGTSAENLTIYNTYLNFVEDFKKFRCYFRSQASTYINHFKKYPFMSSLHPKNIPSEQIRKLVLDQNRYILDDDSIVSPREYECLCLLADGYSAKIIADLLDIGTRTVETHIQELKIKLNCTNTANLVYKAAKAGLI